MLVSVHEDSCSTWRVVVSGGEQKDEGSTSKVHSLKIRLPGSQCKTQCQSRCASTQRGKISNERAKGKKSAKAGLRSANARDQNTI
eukprot:765641-Hanusia_phi.AAC.2